MTAEALFSNQHSDGRRADVVKPIVARIERSVASMLSIETCPYAQQKVWQSWRVEEMLDAALMEERPLNYFSWLVGLENWGG
jgi:hypothetical protein